MSNSIVNTLNLVLIGIVVILGVALMITLIQNQSLSNELQLDDNTLRTAELIETFKEKYSDRKITEHLDSKGIPYRYVAYTTSNTVELLFGKDRVVLKGWNDDGALCIVSNPVPRDILNNCPLKW